MVHFDPWHEAALIYLDNSRLSFELNQYYCTIDWYPIPNPLKFGYSTGKCHRGWYMGDVVSPRFHYGSSCLVNILVPYCQ